MCYIKKTAANTFFYTKQFKLVWRADTWIADWVFIYLILNNTNITENVYKVLGFLKQLYR